VYASKGEGGRTKKIYRRLAGGALKGMVGTPIPKMRKEKLKKKKGKQWEEVRP